MITPQEFEAALKNEHRIIRHLFSLIPQDGFDFKFTPKQRSTLDVLRYLGTVSNALIGSIHEGNTEPFKEAFERAKEITPDNFLEKLDAEEKNVLELMKKFTSAELSKELDLFKVGHAQRKSMWLIIALQTLSAYRMQLFLQTKAHGRDDISTMDLWMGMPTPKKGTPSSD